MFKLNAILLWLLSFGGYVRCHPILDEELMRLTEIALDVVDPPEKSKPLYDDIQVFADDPEFARLGRREGRCFVAFPGTDFTNIEDTMSVFTETFVDFCPLNSTTDCCKTRSHFFASYNAAYRADLEERIEDCVTYYCTYPKDECLILAGHSVGGSVAHVASVVLKDYYPIVITSANEPSLNPECMHPVPTRMYRWVNTRKSSRRGLVYDLWPFRPEDFKLFNFGYTLIMSDDKTGVADIGLNRQTKLRPTDPWWIVSVHNLVSVLKIKGYRERIDDLIKHDSYPIRATGFKTGFPCTEKFECESGYCRRSFLETDTKRCTNH